MSSLQLVFFFFQWFDNRTERADDAVISMTR